MVFAVIGKGSLAASFNCAYIFSGELFPTVIRSVHPSTCPLSTQRILQPTLFIHPPRLIHLTTHLFLPLPSAHPSTQPPAHPSTHPSMQPPTHLSNHFSIHPTTKPSIQPLLHPPNSFIHPASPSTHQPINPSIHPLLHPSNHQIIHPTTSPSVPSTHPSNHFIHPSAHPSIQSLLHPTHSSIQLIHLSNHISINPSLS
nr:PREDICTED: splicing factor 3A subunit 2-like [Struthio camelus australis]